MLNECKFKNLSFRKESDVYETSDYVLTANIYHVFADVNQSDDQNYVQFQNFIQAEIEQLRRNAKLKVSMSPLNRLDKPIGVSVLSRDSSIWPAKRMHSTFFFHKVKKEEESINDTKSTSVACEQGDGESKQSE